MIVKCKEDKGKNLSTQLFSHPGWNDEMEFAELTIGKTYIVYAIIHVEAIPFYLICGDTYDGVYVKYPSLLPSSLFEIIHNQQSTLWELKQNTKDVGFKEILNEKYFYGNLVEGLKREVQIFLSVKRDIDQENTCPHGYVY